MRTNAGMRETDRRDEVRLRDLSCGDRATSAVNTPQFPRENYGACVCAAPTRRKEAVSFPFPAAERRKKFIVGGREENLQGKLKLALGQEKRTWERHLTKVLIINA